MRPIPAVTALMMGASSGMLPVFKKLNTPEANATTIDKIPVMVVLMLFIQAKPSQLCPNNLDLA